jgi:hypothetical protein
MRAQLWGGALFGGRNDQVIVAVIIAAAGLVAYAMPRAFIGQPESCNSSKRA